MLRVDLRMLGASGCRPNIPYTMVGSLVILGFLGRLLGLIC